MLLEPALSQIVTVEEFALRREEHLNPLIYNSQDRDREIGDFFADITRVLFRGDLLPQAGVPSCDAYLHALKAFSEIKGRSDAYGLPLKERQHEDYLEIGDAWDVKPDFVYAIWRYRNLDRRDLLGRRRSLLTPLCKDRRSLAQFLTRTTHTCHLFDIGVVEAVRQTFGVVKYTWRSNQTDMVIPFPERIFQGLHDGTLDGISSRLTKRYRFGSFKFHFLWEGVVMCFTVRAILRPGTYRRLRAAARRFNGQLFVS